jgi:hypothetical protein
MIVAMWLARVEANPPARWGFPGKLAGRSDCCTSQPECSEALRWAAWLEKQNVPPSSTISSPG